MADFYDAKSVEEKYYKICEERGYFEVDGNKNLLSGDGDKRFCIMMPPPNVTGVLHIGHALTFTLQDIMTRYKRMDGYKTLWQPGLDHAGIATQNVVEKQLLAKGIKKEQIGREEFIKKTWEWKEKSGGQIVYQMRRLGITPAWSRERFTMDAGLKNAVKKAFCSLYEKGLIVRGDYMVNWCTHDGALSDVEVEHKANKGKLYYLRYFLADDAVEAASNYIVVATTRPETYFGDTAVMVNPDDERFAHLIGKEVILPLTNKKIKIIADSHVDMSFGTGAVKVTPAHDTNDYEVGKRHNLEFLTIFDEKGILNEHCGQFAGLERLKARDIVVEKLQQLGFVEKIEDYENQVGYCYRCKNVVEPYISKQWFVKAKIAKNAIKNVENGGAQFYPAHWVNSFNAWMRELRDWCISRQLWWGHQIPVFYCECGNEWADENDSPAKCPKCGGNNFTQDPDVLDTWFSSGLWPISTLGWGNGEALKNEKWSEGDLGEFYPNTMLITGFDILFFWVARMMFQCDNATAKLPFKDIYLHALVKDKDGKKMSKSSGNVVDPLEKIDEFSADILRFTLALLCIQGRDIRMDEERLILVRNFINKLFNAHKFLLLNAPKFASLDELGGINSLKTPLARFMAAKLAMCANSVRSNLDAYRFNDAANDLYRFLWDEFCDWGIELSKADKSAILELGSVFKEAMKLLSPFMPFISEYLWHELSGTKLENGAESVMVMRYPDFTDCALSGDGDRNNENYARHYCKDRQGALASAKERADGPVTAARSEVQRSISKQECIAFERAIEAIVSIRRAKATIELGNSKIAKAFVRCADADLSDMSSFIKLLAKCESVEFLDRSNSVATDAVRDVSEHLESFVPLDGVDMSGVVARLGAQKAKLEKEILKLKNMLNNEKFVANAPESVLKTNRDGLAAAEAKLEKVVSELANLGAK